jgi:hypothetical protein
MNFLDEKIKVINKVHGEFLKIMQHERCRTCSCLYKDIMTSILDTIQDISRSIKDDSKLITASRDFSKWIEDMGSIDLHQ